jgi:hypothetical protein
MVGWARREENLQPLEECFFLELLIELRDLGEFGGVE